MRYRRQLSPTLAFVAFLAAVLALTLAQRAGVFALSAVAVYAGQLLGRSFVARHHQRAGCTEPAVAVTSLARRNRTRGALELRPLGPVALRSDRPRRLDPGSLCSHRRARVGRQGHGQQAPFHAGLRRIGHLRCVAWRGGGALLVAPSRSLAGEARGRPDVPRRRAGCVARARSAHAQRARLGAHRRVRHRCIDRSCSHASPGQAHFRLTLPLASGLCTSRSSTARPEAGTTHGPRVSRPS